MKTQIPIDHPGTILREEFLEPMNISAYRVAKDAKIPYSRLSMVINGKRSISADTAFRLSRFFGNSAEFWLGLQMEYDLRKLVESKAGSIEKEVVPLRS
jgi:addiction module HigA family antidote